LNQEHTAMLEIICHRSLKIVETERKRSEDF
jgi:hypothetical protein